jgi:hypothetical protein
VSGWTGFSVPVADWLDAFPRPETQPIRRPGTVFVAKVPPNARIKWLQPGRLVVACPDRPPYIIEPDGSETELDLSAHQGKTCMVDHNGNFAGFQ